jgi:Cytochrome P460
MTHTLFQEIRRAGSAATVACLAGLSFCCGAAAQEPLASSYAATAPKYDAQHDLLLPKGFETWVFVGSNLGLAYKTDMKETTAAEGKRLEAQVFHNIYINPEAYAHFLRTGEFPEPTILVMEQFSAAEKEPKGVLTAGSYNGQRVGMEVAVKNSARPDKVKTPWAYYSFTDQSEPKRLLTHAPAFPDADCETCHRQHASKDNVWVQFYPHLRDATK